MIPKVWAFSITFRAYIYVVGSAPVTASINAEMKGLCRNRRAEKEMMVKNNSEEAQKKWAEKRFKKEERDRDGVKAMLEYQVEGHAVRDKTARLRALRLAKGAAEETR
jgi:ADP-ribosylglycohydrolase